MSDSDLKKLEAWLENREPLLKEFQSFVDDRHSDPWPDFRVTGCDHNLRKGWLKPTYSGVPEGSRHYLNDVVGADRPTMVELAARMTAVRSRRWYPITQTVKPVPPGWSTLVREAFPFICYPEVGDGWSDLMIAMSGWIAEIGVPADYSVSQIKTKFGSLRWYDYNSSDEIDRIVAAAEQLSYGICETCGAPGKSRGGGWIVTACDQHA